MTLAPPGLPELNFAPVIPTPSITPTPTIKPPGVERYRPLVERLADPEDWDGVMQDLESAGDTGEDDETLVSRLASARKATRTAVKPATFNLGLTQVPRVPAPTLDELAEQESDAHDAAMREYSLGGIRGVEGQREDAKAIKALIDLGAIDEAEKVAEATGIKLTSPDHDIPVYTDLIEKTVRPAVEKAVSPVAGYLEEALSHAPGQTYTPEGGPTLGGKTQETLTAFAPALIPATAEEVAQSLPDLWGAGLGLTKLAKAGLKEAVTPEPNVLRLAVKPEALSDEGIQPGSMAATYGSKTISDPSQARILGFDDAAEPDEIVMYRGTTSSETELRRGAFVTPDPDEAQDYADIAAVLERQQAGSLRRLATDEAGALQPQRDPMAEWEYSLKKLADAKAKGPEAFEAEKARQAELVKQRQAEQTAVAKENAATRFSSTGKAKLEERRAAMQAAKEALTPQPATAAPLRAADDVASTETPIAGPMGSMQQVEESASLAGLQEPSVIAPSSGAPAATPPDSILDSLKEQAKRFIAEESGQVQPEAMAETTGKIAKHAVGMVADALGAPIALKSTLTPPIMRQGLVRLVTNPVAAIKESGQSLNAVAEMVKGKPEVARRLQDSILNDPWVRPTLTKAGAEAAAQDRYLKGLGVAAPDAPVVANQGLTWVDVGGGILDWTDASALRTMKNDELLEFARKHSVELKGGLTKDEIIATLMRELRPEELQGLGGSVVGRAVRGSKTIRGHEVNPVMLSDVQMALQLNLQRTNKYREIASGMWKAGNKNRDDYIKLRKLVEHGSQRGSVGQGSLPFFFSTRAMSGRIQYVGDLIDALMHPWDIAKRGPRREAAKELVLLAGTMGGMVALLDELGVGEIKWNDGLPTLDIRGVHHFDPWAGWNGVAKLVVGVGKDIVDNYGDAIEQGGWENVPQNFAQDVFERGGRFLRGGISPAFGKGADIATGKDFLGRPYNFAEDFKSGNFFFDLTAPFLVDAVAEAYKHDGLAGIAVTAPAQGVSLSVNTYESQEQAKDRVSRAMFGVPFTDLTDPDQIARVEANKDVREFKGDLALKREAGREQIEAELNERVEAWKQGIPLEKPLPETIRDYNQQLRGAAIQFAEDFKETLRGFDKDDFDTIVDAYFGFDYEHADGSPDFERIEAAQQTLIEGLPREGGKDSPYEEMKRFLLQVESKRPEVVQDYRDYNARRESLGYFEKGADTTALDRANPDIDVETWRWKGGARDKERYPDPTLQSAQAVELALLMGLPSRDIKLDGLGRPINSDEGTIAAWREFGERADRFISGVQVEREKERIAQVKYKKAWDALNDDQQSAVASHIRDAVRQSSPDLDAYLAWMGRYDTIFRGKAIETLRYLRTTYGREPERSGGPITYRD